MKQLQPVMIRGPCRLLLGRPPGRETWGSLMDTEVRERLAGWVNLWTLSQTVSKTQRGRDIWYTLCQGCAGLWRWPELQMSQSQEVLLYPLRLEEGLQGALGEGRAGSEVWGCGKALGSVPR